jgi:hypothetical protein
VGGGVLALCVRSGSPYSDVDEHTFIIVLLDFGVQCYSCVALGWLRGLLPLQLDLEVAASVSDRRPSILLPFALLLLLLGLTGLGFWLRGCHRDAQHVHHLYQVVLLISGVGNWWRLLNHLLHL